MNREPPKTLRAMLGDPNYRDESIAFMDIVRAVSSLGQKRLDDVETGEVVMRLQRQVREFRQTLLLGRKASNGSSQRVTPPHPHARKIVQLIPENIRILDGNDSTQAVWNRAVSLRPYCDEWLKDFPSLRVVNESNVNDRKRRKSQPPPHLRTATTSAAN